MRADSMADRTVCQLAGMRVVLWAGMRADSMADQMADSMAGMRVVLWADRTAG